MSGAFVIDEQSLPPREGETFISWCARVGSARAGGVIGHADAPEIAAQRLDVSTGAVWHDGRWTAPRSRGFTVGGNVPVAPKVIT